jgi:hypothetical protein
MDWERTHKQLLKAERRVIQAEAYLARARAAIGSKQCPGCFTVNAEEALKRMEVMLEDDIERRDGLKDRLRLLTH